MRPVAVEGTPPWYLTATPLATQPWMVRLHWSTAGLQLAAAAFGWALPHLDFPLRRLSGLLVLAAAANVVRAVWLSTRKDRPAVVMVLGLAADAALLTGLLELTGGPYNPFSLVFAVQVALVSLTLGRLPAMPVALVAATGYGLLIYWHSLEIDPIHHRLNDFPTHLLSAWMALGATAELAAHFVLQASQALAEREDALERLRRQAARTERLMSMTTLAAGAAHELSTPLGTIALASKELERSAAHVAPGLVDDARLIRSEVDRCRAILDQMSGRAGGAAADDPEAVDLHALVDDVRDRLAAHHAARLDVRMTTAMAPVFLPRAGFGQALLSLVKNACDASADRPATPVVVEVSQHAGRLRIVVRDQGTGMPPDVLRRAGEPFFTTKEAGRGLGLGLFLARIFAERTGGSLTLQSGNGTIACLDLPARAAADAP